MADETRMTTTWEYTSVEAKITKAGDLVRDLNALGEQGWEVVGFATGNKMGTGTLLAILKRPG